MSVTINGNGNLTFNDGSVQNTSATGFGFKNRIINGAMQIDQRNAGAATANTINGYTVDRWAITQYANTGKLIAQRNAGSVTPPAGFTNYLGITSQSAYSVGTNDFYILQQLIEGYNVADLGFGTANAQTVTLSFWVRSSLTGTFGGALRGGQNYPFTYSINSANTWEYKTITVAGSTSGGWSTDNAAGLTVCLCLGVGSTYSAAAGSWTNSNIVSASSVQSVVGTNGATFYITGVQLEKGSTATSFDYRPYGTELALCQRYYEYGGQSYNQIWNGNTTSGVQYYYGNSFKVTKRANPTVVTTHLASYGFPATSTTATDATIVGFQANRTANSSVNSGYFIDTWTASAEL